jgi:hypothetical protein
MNRRSLLLGIGAALSAPAIVKAESLMKLWVPPKAKLIDLNSIAASTGKLYDKHGKIVGWWSQKLDKTVDFRWDDPNPTGHWTKGTGHSLDQALMAFAVMEARPYYPWPVTV